MAYDYPFDIFKLFFLFTNIISILELELSVDCALRDKTTKI